MRCSVIQMAIADEKEKNLEHAVELVRKAADDGADLVMLPEMFCCPYTNRSFRENAEPEEGPLQTALAELAASRQIVLVAGSMPERDGEKIYNTSFVYDPTGRRIAKHRKVHLFDIDVEGGQSFRESATFSPGESSTVFDTEFGRFGLCICFDLRFPELAMKMALSGAQALLVPAAFNMTTGPAHWELLFRQRAVDNQMFTLGCAPARDEQARYVSYGNSIVCGPWGNIIARADREEEILTVDLDLTENERIRRQLPLLSARRPEVYR